MARTTQLLQRYEDLSRTNDILVRELAEVQRERDAMAERLEALRKRVDAMLHVLPGAVA